MIEYIAGLSWGTLVGFAIAIPVGPMGLVCIQRTLSGGRTSGLVSGFGAAVADVFLASVGAFSITIIFSFITEHRSILEVVGGFILLGLGIFSLVSKPKEKSLKAEETVLSATEEFLSSFALTITNPLSAFSFFVAFGAISSKVGDGWTAAAAFVAGVFIGSCLWWVLLTYIADRIAHKMNDEKIASINKWFARIITLLGIFILLGVLFRQF